MSGWSLAAAGCAFVAGLLAPSGRDRGLGRLRSLSAPPQRRPRARWRAPVLRARAANAGRAGLVALAEALAAELRAGATPREALWRAARDEPQFAAVAAAARSPAGDVGAALQQLCDVPGCTAAADLATAWVVCETSGGRLARPVSRLAGAWRDEEQVRREVTAQLAGPRATAVLLAGLPLVGVAMGAALGSDPLLPFRRPSVALVTVLPGLLLEAVGLLWIAGLTRRAATW
jgi:tight adherence protein B